MLLQSLRVLCVAPGGSGSVLQHLEALVRLPGVSGRIACCFRTDFHFADVRVYDRKEQLGNVGRLGLLYWRA